MESPTLTVARMIRDKHINCSTVNTVWLEDLVTERECISAIVKSQFHPNAEENICTCDRKIESLSSALEAHRLVNESNESLEQKEVTSTNIEEEGEQEQEDEEHLCKQYEHEEHNLRTDREHQDNETDLVESSCHECNAQITCTPHYANYLELHALHRRRLYREFALSLSHLSDGHHFYNYLMWCHKYHVFIHPAVYARRESSAFRDHAFYVRENVSRLTPLIAIPESLLIGFVDVSEEEVNDEVNKNGTTNHSSKFASSRAYIENNLYDAEREKEFSALNVGTGKMRQVSSNDHERSTDTDVCDFFFRSLGMIVADLITARSSPLSDRRHCFASSLSKTRTLQNAPYFDDEVAFSEDEPCLADVFLQMIRNYINGGPLVNKVSRSELQWAVSVCLSHSTPLRISSTKSIGLIPLIHLFPHGGAMTNCYIVSRTTRSDAAAKMTNFFNHTFHMDFNSLYDGKWIYVVPDRMLHAHDAIHLQAMAPVCDSDDDAEQMWRLSCGGVPETYKTSAHVAAMQQELSNEIIERGAAIMSSNKNDSNTQEEEEEEEKEKC